MRNINLSPASDLIASFYSKFFQKIKSRTISLTAIMLISMGAGFNNTYGQVAVTQNFDAATFPPTGWTTTGTYGSTTYLFRAGNPGANPAQAPHAGTGQVEYNSYSINATAGPGNLITPVFDLTGRGASTPTVTLWFYRDVTAYNTTTYDGEGVNVYVNTTAALGGTALGYIPRRGGQATSGTYLVAGGTSTTTTSGWYSYTFNIPAAYNTASNYLIFNFMTYYGDNCFMDDVSYVTYPCTPPTVTGPSAAGQSKCVNTGSFTALSVTPTTGVTYQWYQNSTPSTTGSSPVSLATLASYTPLNTAVGTAYYYCVVTSSGCSTTSGFSGAIVSGAVPSTPTGFSGTLNPDLGATLQPYSVTNVSGVNYAWSFPSGWSQTGGTTTNSVTATVGTVNGNISVTPSTTLCGNGTPLVVATTIPAYRSKFTAYNIGASATWCQGEARNITVTVTNNGTSAWSTAFPVNIGAKWNTNGIYWNDYNVRTSAANLAPGASATYTLPITAANATAGPTYAGGNLATGSNNITFDIVKESDCWFGANNGSCGPGNSVYTTATQTIAGVPTSIASTPAPATGATGVCYAGPAPVTSVSWAAVSDATSYDVYFGSSGLPGTLTANVATNAYTCGTLSANTTYTWQVVARNTCGTIVGSSTWTFATASAPCYCIPTSSCSSTDVISNVTFAGINNSTGCSAGTIAAGYNDFTSSVGAASVNAGTTYSLTSTVTNGGTEYVAFWIDFDHSTTFDASEYFYVGSGAGGTFTNSAVTIPTTATGGATTMRVRVRYNTTLANTDACTSYTFGETEDYRVNISVTPTLSVGSLGAFGSLCAGSTSAANSFTVTGTNLTTADVTIGTSAGYAYSTSSGGTYTSTLSIPHAAGAFSQTVFVKFTPPSSGSYTTNIAVGGAGASAVTVTPSGTGVTPVVTPVGFTPTTAQCAGTVVSYSVTNDANATSYTWTVPAGWSGSSTSNSISATVGAAAGTFTVKGNNLCGAGSVYTSPSITVNALPSPGITPATPVVCGTTPATLAASGGTSYKWSVNGSPNTYTNLYTTSAASTAYTGTNVNPVYANPTASTTYAVTVTDANSCTASTTKTVTYTAGPSLSATANPSTICSGGNSVLNVGTTSTSSYTVAPVTYALEATPGSGVTILQSGSTFSSAGTTSTGDDQYNAATIPFSFSFFGTAYTTAYVGTNGYVTFGAGSTQYFSFADLPSSSDPSNLIAACARDLRLDQGGTITYFTNGTTPNRRFVVNYNGVIHTSGSTPTVTAQIVLYETSNKIRIISTNIPLGTQLQGIQNSGGTLGYGTTTLRGSVANPWTASSDAYEFSPGIVTSSAYSYTWSPSTFGVANIQSPTATNVTATTTYTGFLFESSTGCTYTAPSVTVTTTAPPAPNAITGTPSLCVGGSTTLSSPALSITTTGSPVITTSGSYTLYTYNSSGSFTLPVSGQVDVLTVGGGGGGGGNGGGGGGGGAVVTSLAYTLSAGTTAITVGGGGAAGINSSGGGPGSKGGTSTFGAIFSAEGGTGGSNRDWGAAPSGTTAGGSAGGGGGYAATSSAVSAGGIATGGGGSGGNSTNYGTTDKGCWSAGGGGGGASGTAGTAGATNSSTYSIAGNGGAGAPSAITGLTYGGGGGGNCTGYTNCTAGMTAAMLTVGTGGAGGGGNGNAPGGTNTGGGAGGGYNGGSGVVVVRVPTLGTWSSDNANIPVSSTGVVTATTSGTANITYTITGSSGCTSKVTTLVTAQSTAAPAVSTTQSLCSGATVANLSTTGGTSVQWYATAGSVSALTSGTVLTSTTYYATQTLNTCESTTRTPVSVTVTSSANNATLATSSANGITLAAQCTEASGWTYYADPSAPNNWLFGVYKNGNTFVPTITLTVNSSPTETKNDTKKKATYTLDRYWNLSLSSGSVSSSLPVKVRFFYAASDTAAMRAAAVSRAGNYGQGGSSINGLEWFKTTAGVPFDPANNTYSDVPNKMLPTIAYGALNGISYVEYQGLTSFSGGTAGMRISPTGVALPVTLLYLTATPVENSYIKLDWATGSEINNKGFEIEHSTDGVTYETIGWVDGHGNSNQQIDYSYNDKAVAPNSIYYYRLKQIDVDGKFDYSNIVSGTIIGKNGFVVESLRPNPANDKVSVQVVSMSAQNATVSVTDMLGREVVNTQSWQIAEGFNGIDIDLSTLAAGTYNVIVRSQNQYFTKKLVVSR